MMRALIAVLWLLFASSTPAQELEYRYVHGFGAGAQSPWGQPRGATCSALPGFDDPGGYDICGNPSSSGPRIISFYWESNTCKRRIELTGPGGCTSNGHSGASEESRPFVANCTQGQVTTKNVRVGFGRYTSNPSGALWKTEDGRGYMASQSAPTNPPNTLCDGSCEQVADGAAGDWWYNVNPNAAGLHEIFREQTYTTNGATCTQKAPEVDSAVTGSCDGFVGELNGKTVCIAKEPPSNFGTPAGAKPTTSTANSNTRTMSTNPDGSPGAKTGPNGEVPGKTGDRTGMVDLSGTGKGSATTPSTGTSTGPDGTRTTQFDLQVCGMPGKPACKMDESGTPDGRGDHGQGALKTAADSRDAALGSITSSTGKDTGWGSLPSWFTPKECTAWHLFDMTWPMEKSIDLDLCPHMSVIHGVGNVLCAIMSFLGCLSLVGSAMGVRSS